MKRKNVEELARRASIAFSKTSIASNNENNALKRTSRDLESHHKHIEAIRDDIVSHDVIELVTNSSSLPQFLVVSRQASST